MPEMAARSLRLCLPPRKIPREARLLQEALLIGVLLFSYRRRTAFGFDGELVQSAKTRQRIFCSIPAI